MKVWLSVGGEPGELLDAERARVPVLDHGLTVGDGVFETLKVGDGVPFALTRHRRRLEVSARGLGLAVPADDVLHAAVGDVLGAADEAVRARGRLRVTLTGGVAPLGSDRGSTPPTVVVAAAPLAPWPPAATVVTVPWARNERSAVAGLKTTSYAENVVALAHARAAGAAEALFADTSGRLSEGTGSNVFVVRDGRVLTPGLASGCLPGITRGLVLEWCGAAEADLSMRDLEDADEVFLTSSTRDVQPVSFVDGRGVPLGPITADAAATFARNAAATPDP